MESGRWFVAPFALIGQQTRGVFQGDDKVADYLVKPAQVGLAGGAVLGTWGQFGNRPRVDARQRERGHRLAGAAVRSARTRRGFGRGCSSTSSTTRGSRRTDSPATGSAYAALTSLGSAQSYQRLEGSFRVVRSWGSHTVQVGVAGGTDLGSDMPAYESFTLGGPLRLSGYRINQFAGRQYAFGRLMYYNRVFPLPDLLGSGVYAGASAEVGRMSDRFDSLPTPGTLWSGSLFLGADTFLGPAFVGVGAAPARKLEPVHAARRAVADCHSSPVGAEIREPTPYRPCVWRHARNGACHAARGHPTPSGRSPRCPSRLRVQPPGGRYAIDCFAASSTSATVISTTVFTDAPPA